MRIWWLAPFERGQPELQLVDPVPEDLQLSLVGEPPLHDSLDAIQRRGTTPAVLADSPVNPSPPDNEAA